MFVLRHSHNNENMVRKGMLLVTDVASKNNGWLRAFEGERDDPRRLTTTSNISVKYSFVSYIVLGRDDSTSSAWFNINACRASQMRHNSLMEPQAELKIVLVFAPSHGDLAGEMVWRMPKMISPLDELHAIDWLRAAVLEGYQRVHFHTCCVAASFKELGASSSELGFSVTVTAFMEEIHWSRKGPSAADKWVLHDFTRETAPLGDGWRFAMLHNPEGFTLASRPQVQGREPKKKGSCA